MKPIAVSLVLVSVFGLWSAGSSFAKDDNLEKMPTFNEEPYRPTSQAATTQAVDETRAVEVHKHPKLTFSKEFERVKALAGRWEGTGRDEKGEAKPVSVEYKVTSGGSAVVETLFPGTDNEMVSVYHDKDGKLSMTHYCMLGNQPELEVTSATDSRVDLVMSPESHASMMKELHMHSLTLEWAADGSLKQTWTALSPDGKAMEPAVISVRKV